jgi:hypothetical protein
MAATIYCVFALPRGSGFEPFGGVHLGCPSPLAWAGMARAFGTEEKRRRAQSKPRIHSRE